MIQKPSQSKSLPDEKLLRAGYAELHNGVIPPELKIGGAQGANHLSFSHGGRARVAAKGHLIKEHLNLKTDSRKKK